MVLLGEHFDAQGRKLVLQFEDGELVAGNDARGKDHRVAVAQGSHSDALSSAMRESAARGSPWLPVHR